MKNKTNTSRLISVYLKTLIAAPLLVGVVCLIVYIASFFYREGPKASISFPERSKEYIYFLNCKSATKATIVAWENGQKITEANLGVIPINISKEEICQKPFRGVVNIRRQIALPKECKTISCGDQKVVDVLEVLEFLDASTMTN